MSVSTSIRAEIARERESAACAGLASWRAISDNGVMEARDPHEEITLLLGDARRGSAHAQERLYSHVYRELHRLAERQLRGDREHGGATSLVHEAFQVA